MTVDIATAALLSRIRTKHVCPPIGTRACDWQATTDDYDGAPDAGPQLRGEGPTEAAAIADLISQMAD